MIRELRDFLFRGNIISLAIAVIMGAAFTAVVTARISASAVPAAMAGRASGRPKCSISRVPEAPSTRAANVAVAAFQRW